MVREANRIDQSELGNETANMRLERDIGKPLNDLIIERVGGRTIVVKVDDTIPPPQAKNEVAGLHAYRDD